MADDNEVEKQLWHWRNTMRPVRFFNLDARASFPFAILLVYARPITFILTLAILGIFYFFERQGLTTPSAMRAFRVWIIGNDRPAWFSIRHRKMRDYG